MTDKPARVTEAAEALLVEIAEKSFPVGYPRPKKSPQRDELKRAGLIESARPGLHRSVRTIYWRPTEAGEKYLEEMRK